MRFYLSENFKKLIVRQKEETWESNSFCLEVSFETFEYLIEITIVFKKLLVKTW